MRPDSRLLSRARILSPAAVRRMAFWALKTCICIALCMSLIPPSHAGTIRVLLRDIPRPVILHVPEAFQLAQDPDARQRRDRLLQFYSGNPGYRGKYDEVLLRDWAAAELTPSIVVSTLGSASKWQGRISEANWRQTRALMLDANRSQLEDIRRAYRARIDAGGAAARPVNQELIWVENQRDPSSVVVLAYIDEKVEGKDSRVYSARKLIYFNGYVLVVNVVVSAVEFDALNVLQRYLSDVSVEGLAN